MKIRPLIVLILTFGVIWGCETTDPLVREAQDALQTFQFEEAIAAADRALAEDSSNALAHYYKGAALGSLADDIQPPSDRKPYYEEMRKSMENARHFGQMMEREPSELENIPDVILSVWANEHNAGAEILTDDSVRQATERPEETARDHFINATTIEPDSSISFIVLSSVQYQLGELEAATRTYEDAMSKMDDPAYEDYEYLISLYFVQDRFEDARDLALTAIDRYPEEEAFVQFLADTYLELGEGAKAIELLRTLIEDNPDNSQYYFVLGTQLFRNAQNYLDDAGAAFRRAWTMEEQAEQLSGDEREALMDDIENVRKEAEEFEAEGNRLADLAIEEMETYLEMEPQDDNAYNIMGIVYQNRASALFDKRNNTRDMDRADIYDKQARDNLVIAKQYYEQAAEINPDETEYWESLFQVYTTLGMDEEADAAEEKAGFND